MIKALKAWIDIRPGAEHRQVFTGNDLTPLKPRGVQERVQELGRSADVAVPSHMPRHSFAKNLINAGVDWKKWRPCGHSSGAVTRRYTTPSEIDLVDAVVQIVD